MRKIIFCIVIVLLLVLAGFIGVTGLKIGSFEIWGFKSISEQNKNLDLKNMELSNLVDVTYPATLSELKMNSEELNSTKKEYEQKVKIVSNSKYYMQTEKYEIDFLWTKLGNYAKDNAVQIKIDVVNSSTEGLYDLKFTIAGIYADIIEFLYDVENDSRLGFKIEEFHMSAVEGGVQARFTCKEIGINIEMTAKDENLSEEDEETEQTEDKNEESGKKTETTNTNAEGTANEEKDSTTNNSAENQEESENT